MSPYSPPRAGIDHWSPDSKPRALPTKLHCVSQLCSLILISLTFLLPSPHPVPFCPGAPWLPASWDHPPHTTCMCFSCIIFPDSRPIGLCPSMNCPGPHCPRSLFTPEALICLACEGRVGSCLLSCLGCPPRSDPATVDPSPPAGTSVTKATWAGAGLGRDSP